MRDAKAADWRGKRRAGFVVALVATFVAVAAGCGSSSERTVVRGADDVQVMTPKQVRDMKASAAKADASGNGEAAPGDTVPQNADDRPVEQRIFEAFADFRSCLADSGQTIQGNLLDRNNPAFKDPEYVKTLQKCAARTKIAETFQEFQSVRANLTPEQVEERNEQFKKLQPCLEKRGWTIETSISEIGLIEPTTFMSPDGGINERDVQQCAAEVGVDASDD
jgi:hypothetical protein